MYKELSRHANDRLKLAQSMDFGEHITAYLLDVHFNACCGLARCYGHRKAHPSGLFADGHAIRTSDVIAINQWSHFWSFLTVTGSHYVIVTFAQPGGRESLKELVRLLTQGIYPSVEGYQ